MDEVVNQKGSDGDSNVFRSFILKQLAGSIPLRQREGFPRSGMVAGGDDLVKNSVHLPSFQPWFYRRENAQSSGLSGKVEKHFSRKYDHKLNGSMDFSYMNSSPSCLGLSDRQRRSRSYLRSRRPHRFNAKMDFSMENCLIPQLYNDCFEFEEYVFSVNSPSNVRPFIVSTGLDVNPRTKALSMPGGCELDMNVDVVNTGLDEPVIGLAPLSEPRKLKGGSKKLQQGASRKLDIMDMKFISSSQDQPNRKLLYCLGVAIGAMLTIKLNKRELDELNLSLKLSESFVRDLQEELLLKQSLTVIELSNESYENRSASHFSEEEQHQLSKEKGSLEAMSKIEEELKAELEMLELSMNDSNLETKISQFNLEFNAKVNNDTKDPVSPRELSLHLLELNQNRLEERIKELENALAENEKKIHLWEQQSFLNSDV